MAKEAKRYGTCIEYTIVLIVVSVRRYLLKGAKRGAFQDSKYEIIEST